MSLDELMNRSRDAAQRAREALAAAKATGGPGWSRHALAAAVGPLDEIKVYADAAQCLREVEEKLEDRQRRLRSLRQDTVSPAEVKRRRAAQLEAEIVDLKAARRDWETEMRAKRLPAPPQRPLRSPPGGNKRQGGALPSPVERRALAPDPDVPASRHPKRIGDPANQARVASAGAIALPGGATLHPAVRGRALAIDWPRSAKSLVRSAPRAAAAAGAALSVLLTPTNSQVAYHYFGEDGDERLHAASGDLYGVVERRDPQSGAWRETDFVGKIATTAGEQGEWVVSGTPEQVARAGRQDMSQPDEPLPQTPPLIPPGVPEMGEAENFPIEERGPTIHDTPAEDRKPDFEIFPIPDLPQAQAEVFLALSDEIIREVRRPLEAHRGDRYTRRGNDIVVQKVYEQLQCWFPDIDVKKVFNHRAGATVEGTGKKELKERFVRGEGGRYSIPDIKIRDTLTGRWVTFNTGQVLNDGVKLTAVERRQLTRLRSNLGDTGVAEGLPKLRPGMDEAEYTARVEKRLEEFFVRYFGGPPSG